MPPVADNGTSNALFVRHVNDAGETGSTDLPSLGGDRAAPCGCRAIIQA